MTFRRYLRDTIRVRKIKASRAVFESEEIQRVDVDIDLDYSEKIRLEMTPQQTYKLITELMSAYHAICPPIRGTQNPYSF